MRFPDRREAGRVLADRLASARLKDPVVLGLPRGGVPVAFEVARELGAPLDVLIVRKLGVPYQRELAMGALGEENTVVLNPDVLGAAGVSEDELAAAEERARAEVESRAARYRRGRPPVSLAGKTALIVDDGLATGATAAAGIKIARARGAARVILAVPVGPPDTVAALSREADDVVCIETPVGFLAVGAWYQDFSQTSDDEVVDLLDAAAARGTGEPRVGAAANPDDDPPTSAFDEEVVVPVDSVELAGHLTLPERAHGVVLFAHGSGSSRHSPRNRLVAQMLNARGVGTLLFDLLTDREAMDRANVFDIDLLGARLATAAAWAALQPATRALPLGYFGASTGGGAALWAAADSGVPVRAIVVRGGRPDLALERLGRVGAPTLLIVGGRDQLVLELNRDAAAKLRCEHRIEVVPGATHLFEEPGTLEAVGELAGDWFLRHFAAAERESTSTGRSTP